MVRGLGFVLLVSFIALSARADDYVFPNRVRTSSFVFVKLDHTYYPHNDEEKAEQRAEWDQGCESMRQYFATYVRYATIESATCSSPSRCNLEQPGLCGSISLVVLLQRPVVRRSLHVRSV